MYKKFVIDSSVFLFSPHALSSLDGKDIIIPSCTLEAVRDQISTHGEFYRAAVEFSKELDSILDSPGKSVELGNGGTLMVLSNENRSIYDVAASLDAAIISKDPIVRVIARSRGIPSEPFVDQSVQDPDELYEGRVILYVSSEEMDQFAREKRLILNERHSYYALDAEGNVKSSDYHLSANEYAILIAADDPSKSMLGRFDGAAIVPLIKATNIYGAFPLNAGQRFALDALMNPQIPLVILRGPAGTAKTFLSLAAALEQTSVQSRYSRILLTRPNIKMDSDIGYLKGDEQDKILPIIRGLVDNIETLNEQKKADTTIQEMIDKRIIEPQALAYMRGRSINRQFIIADEMQNSTPTQSLSIITRAGFDSKIVLCGDTQQIDLSYLDRHSNGLTFAAERMKGSSLCAQVTFIDQESTRSDLASDAVRRMGSMASRAA